MNHQDAIHILAHRFESPTQGHTEELVEALHAIIADVIDSCALAAKAYITEPSHLAAYQAPALQAIADGLADEMLMTVNDYVGSHYGVEEFGL